MQDSLKLLVLKLHALGNKDKRWIMNKLSGEERDQVEKLLSEIDGIKNIYNKDALNQSIADLKDRELSSSSADSNREKSLINKLIKKVDRLEHEKVIPMLAKEEPWVLALILKLNQWSWARDLERNLSYELKTKIQQIDTDFDYEANRELIIVVLKLLSDAGNGIVAGKAANQIIDFDEYTAFIEPQNSEAGKQHWWRELWQS